MIELAPVVKLERQSQPLLDATDKPVAGLWGNELSYDSSRRVESEALQF